MPTATLELELINESKPERYRKASAYGIDPKYFETTQMSRAIIPFISMATSWHMNPKDNQDGDVVHITYVNGGTRLEAKQECSTGRLFLYQHGTWTERDITDASSGKAAIVQ